MSKAKGKGGTGRGTGKKDGIVGKQVPIERRVLQSLIKARGPRVRKALNLLINRSKGLWKERAGYQVNILSEKQQFLDVVSPSDELLFFIQE